MEVYLDILIIENLVMNYLILWVTARFSKEPTTFFKLIMGAFTGAVYAAVIFFPALKFIYTITFKVLLSFTIVIICFSPNKLKNFLKVLSIFYIVSFVFGGAAFGLFYFTNFGAIISNGVFYISDFPIKTLFISSIISYFIIRFSWTAIQNRLSKENMSVVIEIFFDNKKTSIKALIDTGNSLYDPISDSPVIVVEYEAIKHLLPDSIRQVFTESKENDLSFITTHILDTNWIARIRLIPFSSLGKQNGLLLGFKPDRVLIINTEGKKELTNVLVGVYNNKLSKDQNYNALLHPEIINF